MSSASKQVVAIGIFDGVHRGHQKILARAREIGNALSLPVVALTFHPHPTAVLAPDMQPSLLLNIHSRLELLEKHGANDVEVLTFSKEFSSMSPQAFIEDILIDLLTTPAPCVSCSLLTKPIFYCSLVASSMSIMGISSLI